MWKRKELKKEAKAALKGNYLRSVIVCLVMAFVVGAYATSYGGANQAEEEYQRVNFRGATNTEIVNSIVSSFVNEPVDYLKPSEATRGAIASIFNNSTRAGSFVFGTLNAINQFIFGDRIMAGIVVSIGAAILFLYWMFIGNILRIGACRFFIESKYFEETKVNHILYLYKLRKVWNPAKIMLLKTVYIVLWYFTIVGGIIKSYSYRMVPYIVAENPNVTAKEAFALSRQMMRGNKWKAFVLDISYWYWYLLSFITLGLSSFLFVNPYTAATNAELYLHLRGALPAKPDILNDPVLNEGPIPGALGEYPVEAFPIPESGSRAWLTASYTEKYPINHLILIFFVFCMIGWVWEVFGDLINTSRFVNRGTLYGPWLPIYGTGGLLMLVLLRKWVNKPVVTFFAAFALCGVLEYITSFVLELYTGATWWDYSGYFMNINGRICLEGLLVFAIGGCLIIYFVAPILNNKMASLRNKTKNILCIVLVGAFLADLLYALVLSPNMQAGVVAGQSSSHSIRLLHFIQTQLHI